MKKLLLLSTIFFVAASGIASHLMGGQITANQINGLTYEINLTLYRDATGITMPNQTTIQIAPTGGGNTFSVTASHNGPVILLNGVEEYTYIFLVTFPSMGSFDIWWSSCCRNAAILNINNAGSQSFFIFNTLYVDTNTGNSSPVFLNPPVVVAQLNDTFYYNPLPFDADGDSLVWQIDTPLGTGPLDILPYVTPSASAGGAFTMNSFTGEITWIPNTLGHFVASFIIEEFRNGVKIGEIRRDMQYIVVDVPGNVNRASVNTSGWPVDANGNILFDVDINSPFTLSIIVTDNDNDTIDVQANGEPLILANNPATWNNISTIPGSSVNEFTWSPGTNEMRANSYLVVFRIMEYHGGYILGSDQTIQLKVGDFTSVNENTAPFSIGNIYPVPSSGELFIPVTVNKTSDIKISFFNQLGQEVNTFDKKLIAGQNLLYFSDLNLPAGIYFVKTTIDGEKQVKRLVIEK